MNEDEIFALRSVFETNPDLFAPQDYEPLSSLYQGVDQPPSLFTLQQAQFDARDNNDFSFGGVLSQFGLGFIQGFTTLPAGDDPDNIAEAISRNVGNVLGFLGIIPGVGTVAKIGFNGLTRGVLAAGKAFGATERAAKVIGATGRAGSSLISKGEMFGKPYTRVTSVPFLVAEKAYGALSKRLSPNAVKFLSETKAGTALREGFIGGVASGVSTLPYGFSEAGEAGLIGATENAVFRAVSNAIPGKGGTAIALRAVTNAAYSGAYSGLRDDPLPITVYHTLLGGLLGADDLPFNEIRANGYMARKMQGTSHMFKGTAIAQAMKDPEFADLPTDVQEIVKEQFDLTLAANINYVDKEGVQQTVGLGEAISLISAADAAGDSNYFRNLAIDAATRNDADAANSYAEMAFIKRVKEGIDEETTNMEAEAIAEAEQSRSAEAEREALESFGVGTKTKEPTADPSAREINEQAAYEALDELGKTKFLIDGILEGTRSDAVENASIRQTLEDHDIPLTLQRPLQRIASFVGAEDLALVGGKIKQFADEIKAGTRKFNDIELAKFFEDIPMYPADAQPKEGATDAEVRRFIQTRARYSALRDYMDTHSGKSDIVQALLREISPTKTAKKKLVYVRNKEGEEVNVTLHTAGSKGDDFENVLPNGDKISEDYDTTLLDAVLEDAGVEVRYLDIALFGERKGQRVTWTKGGAADSFTGIKQVYEDLELAEKGIDGDASLLVKDLVNKGWIPFQFRKDSGQLIVTKGYVWEGLGVKPNEVDPLLRNIYSRLRDSGVSEGDIRKMVEVGSLLTPSGVERSFRKNALLNNMIMLGRIYDQPTLTADPLDIAASLKRMFFGEGKLFKNAADLNKRMQGITDGNMPVPASFFDEIAIQPITAKKRFGDLAYTGGSNRKGREGLTLNVEGLGARPVSGYRYDFGELGNYFISKVKGGWQTYKIGEPVGAERIGGTATTGGREYRVEYTPTEGEIETAVPVGEVFAKRQDAINNILQETEREGGPRVGRAQVPTYGRVGGVRTMYVRGDLDMDGYVPYKDANGKPVEEVYDGYVYLHNHLYDRMAELMGQSGGESGLKLSTIHNNGVDGLDFNKAFFLRASDDLSEQMERMGRGGIGMIVMDTSSKIRGTRKLYKRKVSTDENGIIKSIDFFDDKGAVTTNPETYVTPFSAFRMNPGSSQHKSLAITSKLIDGVRVPTRKNNIPLQLLTTIRDDEGAVSSVMDSYISQSIEGDAEAYRRYLNGDLSDFDIDNIPVQSLVEDVLGKNPFNLEVYQYAMHQIIFGRPPKEGDKPVVVDEEIGLDDDGLSDVDSIDYGTDMAGARGQLEAIMDNPSAISPTLVTSFGNYIERSIINYINRRVTRPRFDYGGQSQMYPLQSEVAISSILQLSKSLPTDKMYDGKLAKTMPNGQIPRGYVVLDSGMRNVIIPFMGKDTKLGDAWDTYIKAVQKEEPKPAEAAKKKSISVYWGRPESARSTRILSNLAERRFTWNGKDYGSVEHAYQSNKSGSFDEKTYDAYIKAGGYGKKIRGKNARPDFDNLQLMKDLVVESFRQNPESDAAKKLLEYESFTHPTSQKIDKAFLDGLKLAQEELGAKVAAPSMKAEMEEGLEALYIRVPMATQEGARNLKLAGFTNQQGYGVYMHGFDMNKLGGADLDGDKAFFIFDMDKTGGKSGPVRNYYRKFANTGVLKKSDDPLVSDVPTPVKDPKLDVIFDIRDEERFDSKFSVLNPVTNVYSGISARHGNQGIGAHALFPRRAQELIDVLREKVAQARKAGKDVVHIDSSVKVDLFGNKYVIRSWFSIDGFEDRVRETYRINNDLLQRSADSADVPMKNSLEERMQVVVDKLVNLGSEKASPGQPALSPPVKPKSVKASRIAVMEDAISLDSGKRTAENLYDYLNSISNFSKTKTKKSNIYYRSLSVLGKSFDINKLAPTKSSQLSDRELRRNNPNPNNLRPSFMPHEGIIRMAEKIRNESGKEGSPIQTFVGGGRAAFGAATNYRSRWQANGDIEASTIATALAETGKRALTQIKAKQNINDKEALAAMQQFNDKIFEIKNALNDATNRGDVQAIEAAYARLDSILERLSAVGRDVRNHYMMLLYSPINGLKKTKTGPVLDTNLRQAIRRYYGIRPDDVRMYFELISSVETGYSGKTTILRPKPETKATVAEPAPRTTRPSLMGDSPSTSVDSDIVSDPATQAAKAAGFEVNAEAERAYRVNGLDERKRMLGHLENIEAIKGAVDEAGVFDPSKKSGQEAQKLRDRMVAVFNRNPQLLEHFNEVFSYATGEASLFGPYTALSAADRDSIDRFLSFFEKPFDRGILQNLVNRAAAGEDGLLSKWLPYFFPDSIANAMKANDLIIGNDKVRKLVVTKDGVKNLPVRPVYSAGDEMVNTFKLANEAESENFSVFDRLINDLAGDIGDQGRNQDGDTMFKIAVGIREMNSYLRKERDGGLRLTKKQLIDAIESTENTIKIGNRSVEVPEEIMRFRDLYADYKRILELDRSYSFKMGGLGDKFIRLSAEEMMGTLGERDKAGAINKRITDIYKLVYEDYIGDYSEGNVPKRDAKFMVMDSAGDINYAASVDKLRKYMAQNGKLPNLTYNGVQRLMYEQQVQFYHQNRILVSRLAEQERDYIERHPSLSLAEGDDGIVVTGSSRDLREAGLLNRPVELYRKITSREDVIVQGEEGERPIQGVRRRNEYKVERVNGFDELNRFIREDVGGFEYQGNHPFENVVWKKDPSREVNRGDDDEAYEVNILQAEEVDNIYAARRYKTRYNPVGKRDGDVYWARMNHDPAVVDKFVRGLKKPENPADERRMAVFLKNLIMQSKISSEMLSQDLQAIVNSYEPLRDGTDPVFTEAIVRTPSNLKARGFIPFPGWSSDITVLTDYSRSMVEAQAKAVSILLGQDTVKRFESRAVTENQIRPNLIVEWKDYLRTYLQSYLGISSLTTEGVASSDGTKGRTVGFFTSDEAVFEKWRAFDRRFFGGKYVQRQIDRDVENGMSQAEADRVAKQRASNWLRSFSRAEAKYQLATLLANTRSLTNNLVGGSAMTMASVGFRNFIRASRSDYMAGISPNLATTADRIREAERYGVIETFIQKEANLTPAFQTVIGRAALKDVLKLIKQNPLAKDSEIRTILRNRGLQDKLLSTAGWFMQFSERQVRTNAFWAHYLKAREVYNIDRTTRYNDPRLIELAKKGSDASQFLYNSASRPIASATPIGKIFSRFQLYAWNSVRFRRDVYQQAKALGFRQDTPEFERLRTALTADLMVLGLASTLPYSTFQAVAPVGFGALTSLSEYLFGDEEEREKAFFGILPYPANIIGLAAPPGLRILTTPVKGGMALFDLMLLNSSEDLELFLQNDLTSLIPFGSMVKNLYRAKESPQMSIEFLTGLPYMALSRTMNRLNSVDELYQMPFGSARLAVPAMTDKEKRARRKEIREEREDAMLDSESGTVVSGNSDEELNNAIRSMVMEFNSVVQQQ